MATISGEVRDANGDLAADVEVRAYRRDTGALLKAGLSGDGTEGQTGDADFDNVIVLAYMNGANNSTTISDSSGTTRTITAYGNACIKEDQSKFGGASAYFDGTGDYMIVTDSADFDMAGDFTIEFHLRPAAFDPIGGGNRSPLSFAGAAIASSKPAFLLSASGGIIFYPGSVLLTSSSLLNLNSWAHIALVRSGTTITLYFDGVSQGTATYSATIAPDHILIGRGTNASGDYKGYLDNLRITKSVARYTSNFTPPTTEFLTDAIPARPLGEYVLNVSYTGEVNVIALDPSGGDDFNDLILRTTPV